MTGAAALLYFTTEVARASAQLGIETPAVAASDRYFPGREVLAYTIPPYYKDDKPRIEILWRTLWKYPKSTLRCVARHEVIHVALKHERPRNQWDANRQHDQVDVILIDKFHEPAQCGLVDPRRGSVERGRKS